MTQRKVLWRKSKKTKKQLNKKVWLVLPFFLLLNFVSVEMGFANPRKVTSAEWKTGWNHQNATTIRSSDRKTLITNLPGANSINSLTSHFRMTLGGGNNTVVTITPKQYQEWITCPTVTVNRPSTDGRCLAKHHTPNNKGLRYLTQRTKVKIEVKSPGHTARYLYWEFVPLGAPPLTGRPLPTPGRVGTQIYEVGPNQIWAFFSKAIEGGFNFILGEINRTALDNPTTYPPIANEALDPVFIRDGGGVLIKFGNIYPAPAPPTLLAGRRMQVRMFDGKQTLSPGWTFESARYRGQRGENCRKRNFTQFRGTDKVFHEFEVVVNLVSFPPVQSCSKLWLQSIRLKGPAGRRPEEALSQ